MRISHAYNSPLPKFSDSKSQRTSFYDRLRRGSSITIQKKQNKIYQITTSFHFALHGDHCFGLIGLISTLGILGRTSELIIHAHSDAERVFRPQLDYFCRDLPFNVRFNAISTNQNEMIYEDKALKVSTLPLRHRIPTCGFLFEEKEKERHLIRDMIQFYNIPIRELAKIKQGEDFITSEGLIIPNERLSRPADPVSRYAYCSDTIYQEKLIPLIEGVDLLYHEATFAEDNKARAKETFHSTAVQAATLAQKAQVKKLILGHFSARYQDDSIFFARSPRNFSTYHHC